MPKYTSSRPNSRSCDSCGTVIKNYGDRLYLVPFRTLEHSDRALCPACALHAGYTSEDIREVFYIPASIEDDDLNTAFDRR